MKANQKFMEADEAVSPVIGVILMVAITVVLAAVVFVLVSDLGDTGESAPDITFRKDSSAGTVTVIRAESGLTWDDLLVTVTDGDSTTTNCAVPNVSAVDQVTAGDIAAGGAAAAAQCGSGDKVSITHTPTNSLLYETTF